MKIGGGSDLDTDQVHDLLTTATDSICVHTVGFTLTLYRCVTCCNGKTRLLRAQGAEVLLTLSCCVPSTRFVLIEGCGVQGQESTETFDQPPRSPGLGRSRWER